MYKSIECSVCVFQLHSTNHRPCVTATDRTEEAFQGSAIVFYILLLVIFHLLFQMEYSGDLHNVKQLIQKISLILP